MTPRQSLSCLGWISLGSVCLLAACAAESGQTGSPVSQPPPPYQSPERKQPERPGSGGVDSGGGEGSRPNAVPRPLPRPGSTTLLGTTLVIAEHGDLAFVDASNPSQPRVVAHALLDDDAGPAHGEAIDSSLLRADSLERLVLGVGLTLHAADSQLPSGVVPRSAQQLVQVDASDPSAPRIVSRTVIPQDTIEIAVRREGYTALGAQTAASVPPLSSCGVGGGGLAIDLALPLPEVIGLWLETFGPDSANPRRREFGAGHWIVSSDESHAVRIGVPAQQSPTGSFEIELVRLDSLETVFQTRLAPADLGTPLGAAFGADYSDGVLVLAGGSRLLGFDIASSAPLPPLATPGPVESLRFLNASQIVLESSGAALAELDRSASSPALRLVPLAPGTPLTGTLQPFGNGYLALDGTGGPNPLLRATSYAIDGSGALVLVDQLQTNWYFGTNFYNGVPWRVDRATQRLSYSLPANDSDAGFTGLIQGNAGQLSASELAPTVRMSAAAQFYGDTLLGFAGGVLQPITIQPAAAGPQLLPQPAHTVVLEDVWFDVRHAGLIWARHRSDTGKSWLSTRAREYAEPTPLELPHAVDSIVPIDATHVAVLGLSVTGMCEYWRETYPNDAWSECGPNAGNGVSIVAVDAGAPRVVRTIPLSSFLEGHPPPGIGQSIDWQGYLAVDAGQWALWGRFRQECSSKASCESLGVPSYTSYGTSGCSSGQTCDTGTHELVSGSRTESWLFPLDLSDPQAPALEPAVRAGGELRDAYELAANPDLAQLLLGYSAAQGRVWGYAVDDYVFDSNGNSVTDSHGQSLHRWFVQLVDQRSASPSFGPRVNVPGEAVLLAPGDLAGGNTVGALVDHTVFTVEPRYDEQGEQSMWLHRVRVTDSSARIDQSLELGPDVIDARGVGQHIAVLSGPVDYCVDGAMYRLQVVAAEDALLHPSVALELPAGSGFGWSVLPNQTQNGVLQLGGGPALGGGTLTVDLTTDPPSVLRYEY
ncbi:MAG: hypothetical protein ABI895_41700 [Deltaproteobacteria bacterium]